MSEDLHTCPGCNIPNFTAKGLKAHRCKGQKAALVEVTTESPKDPAWDEVRALTVQMTGHGRMFLRCQVRLGMLLADLKKRHGVKRGNNGIGLADSANPPAWKDLVEAESGYSRRSADVFIDLFESAVKKLKTGKKLNLPAPVKKDALALFRAEPLALSGEQWETVDQVIGTLTDGETQASLMRHLKLIPEAKAMPKGGNTGGGKSDITSGQLAFAFFSPVASAIGNARMSPDYKKLLMSLPFETDEENPVSLAALESEARAMIADIEEIRSSTTKRATGRVVSPTESAR